MENESNITKGIVVAYIYPVLGTGCPLITFKEYFVVTPFEG